MSAPTGGPPGARDDVGERIPVLLSLARRVVCKKPCHERRAFREMKNIFLVRLFLFSLGGDAGYFVQVDGIGRNRDVAWRGPVSSSVAIEFGATHVRTISIKVFWKF